MDYKQKVLEKHPNAWCRYNKEQNWHAIISDKSAYNTCIAVAETTEEDAWKRAYNYLYGFAKIKF